MKASGAQETYLYYIGNEVCIWGFSGLMKVECLRLQEYFAAYDR
jgi:hypothetical protein